MTEAQEFILQNFKEPNNFGEPNWIPSASSTQLNPTCGDEVTVYLKIEQNIIKEIYFTGDGCSISIATASILTQEFQNKALEFVANYTEASLLDLVGIPLTTSRKNCALLSLNAIKIALKLKEHN
ncbi:MAG: iron-sulfur cluster assembly scaffold protein [Candidatus Dojkabacteria bacterium]